MLGYVLCSIFGPHFIKFYYSDLIFLIFRIEIITITVGLIQQYTTINNVNVMGIIINKIIIIITTIIMTIDNKIVFNNNEIVLVEDFIIQINLIKMAIIIVNILDLEVIHLLLNLYLIEGKVYFFYLFCLIFCGSRDVKN